MKPEANTSSYLFHIEGVRCHSCIGKIEAVKNLDDSILSAHMYFGQSLLQTTVKAGVDFKKIEDLILKIGFKAQYLQKESESFLLQKKENRKLLNKVAVSGFSTGNIMLFSVPIYAGLEEGFYKTAFASMTLFLFLPVLFYSSVDFFKNALASLKAKSLSIDLPIAIALTSGFVFSAYNLWVKNFDYLYFDSMASFIFLILSSRYFLQRVQQHFVFTNRLENVLSNKKYEVLRPDDTRSHIAIDKIQPKDIITLYEKDIVPTDGVLVDNSAPFDTSFVSGESIPQIFQKGMMITSGSVCINKCQIISTHSFQISSLNKLYQKVEEIKKTKGKFSQISDKISHYLIGSVFLIAILHLAIYFSDDPVMAFQRALALLIVACPCALALGTPLTYAMGIQKAKAANILIKDQNVLDKALSIKNIFFDKTGTLTKGQLRLVETDVEIENKIKNIILNLEKRSNHPVAFGFRNAWAEMYHELNVVDLKEEVGIGVSGTIDGVVYQLRQNSLGDVIKIDFFADGISLCSFQFIDPLREDTEQVIKTLRAKYQNIYLISGDNPKNTETIARSVGLDLAHTFSQQSPEDKLSKITATKNAMMLGDGINDSLALRAADIGISVKGPVTMSLDAANVYFLKSGVASVIDLLSVAKKVRLCLIQNLSISLVYNVTAGALALMGFVNPLVAAILMPISSAALILNTLRVLR